MPIKFLDMKNTLNGFNRRLDTSRGERISGCEDIAIETIQTEAQKIKRLKK